MKVFIYSTNIKDISEKSSKNNYQVITIMNFEHSAKVKQLQEKLIDLDDPIDFFIPKYLPAGDLKL